MKVDLLIEWALQNVVITRRDLFGEGCTFVRFEAEDEHIAGIHGRSALRFGRIVYRHANGETRYSPELFLKVTPSMALLSDLTPLHFFDEALFYAKVLPFYQTFNPQIARLFPQSYNSFLQYNEGSDDAVIVFENLSASGYSQPVKYSFLDYEHLRLMVRKLGEFHAYSYRARQEAAEKFHAMIQSRVEINGIVLRKRAAVQILQTSALRGLEPLSTDPEYNSKLEKLRFLVDHSHDVFVSCYAGDEHNDTHVLCHGDFVSNNILFAYENGKPTNLKMVDLATWRFASPVTDLALILYVNADQKMRDENWNDLIDEYYSAVCNTFPSATVPSKDSILAEFNTNAMVAYFIASYFLPNLIAKDNGGSESIPGVHDGTPWSELPSHVLNDILNKKGGPKATVALLNILKDILDRGFVQ